MSYVLKFADKRVAADFSKLEHSTFEDKRLYKILKEEFEYISKNLRHCTFVPRRLLPKPLLKQYGMDNLWKCNLIDGWRLLYFIESDGEQEIAVIAGWMSHTEYNRLFGYS